MKEKKLLILNKFIEKKKTWENTQVREKFSIYKKIREKLCDERFYQWK